MSLLELGMLQTRRDLALRVWGAFHGLPYLWGGNDPMAGFDCSGFVIEGLKAAGILPRSGDWTAAGLAERFGALEVPQGDLRPGCLLFWNRSRGVGHVEVVAAVIDREPHTIGASGGGSRTSDLAAAIRSDAYVKVRPATPGWVLAVDPFLQEAA